MNQMMAQIEKAIRQHAEGCITYMELIAKIVAIVPPPTDDAVNDHIYAIFIAAINASYTMEKLTERGEATVSLSSTPEYI